VPEIIVGLTKLCCWETPWWWHLGAKTCRSWHLLWCVCFAICFII